MALTPLPSSCFSLPLCHPLFPSCNLASSPSPLWVTQVQLGIAGKKMNLGLFTTELGAAHAFDDAVREHNLDKHLNFPDEANESVCTVCAKAGEHVCCDSCPRVYHVRCVPALKMNGVPERDWFCPCCDVSSSRKSAAGASSSSSSAAAGSRRYKQKMKKEGHRTTSQYRGVYWNVTNRSWEVNNIYDFID